MTKNSNQGGGGPALTSTPDKSVAVLFLPEDVLYGPNFSDDTFYKLEENDPVLFLKYT